MTFTFAMGLVLGAVCIRYASLLAPIVVHIVQNILSTPPAALEETLAQDLLYGLSFLALLAWVGHLGWQGWRSQSLRKKVS